MTSDGDASGPPDENAAIRLRIGAQVSCRDGRCGHLARVIIDPVAHALTHLVVESRRHHKFGRLVPVELVESSGDRVRLRCTRAEFERLDEAEEVHFLPCDEAAWGYGSGEVLALPYYGLPVGGLGVGDTSRETLSPSHAPQPVVSDRVPAGEVEIRRGDQVRASDGLVGTVQGLVIDPRDDHVTHMLLQEGHLWGRRQVTIPIGALSRHAGVVQVQLTRREIGELPQIESVAEGTVAGGGGGHDR